MTANDFRRNAAEAQDPQMLGAQDKMRYACWLIRFHDPRAGIGHPENRFWRALADDLAHWAQMPDKTREYTGGDWSAFNNAQVMADGYTSSCPRSATRRSWTCCGGSTRPIPNPRRRCTPATSRLPLTT
jgi:hypothetical protein